MNKAIAVALLAAGIILLIFGFNASESIGSEVSEAVSGTPTDRSIFFLIGGAVLAIIGGFGLIRRRA